MICLDTTAIIDFLNGRQEIQSLIKKYKEYIITTEIAVFETFLGIYKKKIISQIEEDRARDFFNSIEVLPMKQGCGKIAAKILADLSKKGKTIGQNDCMMASIMIKNGHDTIITKNIKHFSKIKGIKIISY